LKVAKVAVADPEQAVKMLCAQQQSLNALLSMKVEINRLNDDDVTFS
jgi:hypothetical protein